MVMNPKIIKVTTAIEKVKNQIAELQAKQKDLEKQKTQFENDEIVAMFRREKLNEDEFAAILQAGKGKMGQAAGKPQAILQSAPQTALKSHAPATPQYEKEDEPDADTDI